MSRLSSTNLCAQSQSCSATSTKQSGQPVTTDVLLIKRLPMCKPSPSLYCILKYEEVHAFATILKRLSTTLQTMSILDGMPFELIRSEASLHIYVTCDKSIISTRIWIQSPGGYFETGVSLINMG